MGRIPGVLLSAQFVLSAFAWATGSGWINVETLPDYIFWLAPFAGPAAFLIHGPEALYVYLLALVI